MTTTTERTPVATPQQPGRRGGLRSVLLVIGVVILITGGLSLVSLLMRTSETETLRFDEAVSAVEIDADAGSVEIVGAGESKGAGVTVTRQWGLGDRPVVDGEVVDGTLRLRGDCSNGWLFWWANPCSTSFVVTVPSDVAVVVETAAGSVDLRDITDGATVRTSAGSIDLVGVGGTLDLRTSAGSIEGDVASAEIDAVTSAGSIAITDTVVPERIVARSSAGRVEIVVPDEVYRVETSTSAGSEHVEVDTSGDSSRLISVTSSAGNVSVLRGPAR